MPDIRIRRPHSLGLKRAREIAWEWVEQVEEEFGMQCVVDEGESRDTVEFQRSGCQGRLIVAADHFDLDARLGFLLGAFSGRIESEIEKTLDRLLAANGRAAEGRPPAGRGAAAAKGSAGKPATRAAKAPAAPVKSRGATAAASATASAPKKPATAKSPRRSG